MATQVASEDKKDEKDGAKVDKGSEICTEKTSELLKLAGLPNGRILPVDIQEYGYVEDTGFVWMKWKVEQKFKAIGRLLQYDTEISGYVEQQKTKKAKKVSGLKRKKLREWITIKEISIDDPASAKKEVSGVNSKELPEWITISEISIDGPASAKICFNSDIGNNKSFSGKSALSEIKNG